jgi:hypothetical protein
MAEEFEPLTEPFSTADAGPPALSFERGQLRVSFSDWREQPIILLFRDVAAFAWEGGDAGLCNGHRDDSSYVVVGSSWLQRHLDAGTITASEGHRHYKLCFNVVGVLQVIATGLQVSD